MHENKFLGYTLNVHLEISQKILYFVFDMRLFFSTRDQSIVQKKNNLLKH